jgi:hypothetical protein
MANVQALFEMITSDLGRQGFKPLSLNEQSFASTRHVAASMLLRNVLKKYSPESKANDRQTSRATLTFLETCQRLEMYPGFVPEFESDAETLGLIKDELYKFWNVRTPQGPMPLIDSPADLWSHLRPGPGSSLGALGEDFYTKLFASPLTYSCPSLYQWYKLYTKTLPLWDGAESLRHDRHGRKDRVTCESRFSVVPKNSDTGRGICTEPSINMLFQLGTGAILTHRLKTMYGIDLSTQESVNQRLARRGSITGHLATIDLQSASDSISLVLLRQILPRDFYEVLTRFRTNRISIDGLPDRFLPMVSTMGNGYTFPLQTILFSAIVRATYRSLDIKPVPGENIAVYGDDIICEVKAYRRLVRNLRLCGFLINDDKSFSEGPFRESCGADFWSGVNVRSPYIRRLETQQDVYVAINILNLWSWKTGLSLPRSIQWLLARCKWLPVPRWESDDAGIKVPYVVVDRPNLRRCKFVQSPMYRYFATKPRSLKIEGNEENSPGALLALLGGYVRNGKVGLRSKATFYTLRWNQCPSWDVPVDQSVDSDWLLDQQWNTAVYLNLFS